MSGFRNDFKATVQALGQGQRPLDAQGILSVESLMNEIIDRAYDEDDEMGVRSRASIPLHAWPGHGCLMSMAVCSTREYLSNIPLHGTIHDR